MYTNRRRFISGASIAAARLIAGGAASKLLAPTEKVHANTKLNVAFRSPFSSSEKISPLDDVTHYNNFYEFGTDKGDPAKKAPEDFFLERRSRR